MGRERDNFSSLNREPPRLDGTGRHAAPPSAPAKPERDWKRSFLIAGLGTLSWVATYVGMLELIEANMGNLPFIHKVIIGFSVAMLMTMIIWLLDQLFKPHTFVTKSFYAFGYVFLSLISVGFGFGFYWKVLESRGEASRSAESAVGQVQGSLHAASTRLEQLQATLIQLTQVSTDKAELERTKGTSCPNSKPGDGPRRKMREEDAQRFQFSSEFVKGRVGSVKGELSALNDDMIRIVSDDPALIDAKSGNRNEFMRALSRKLDMTVTGFNAFRTDPQLKQMRSDLADRAERTTFADNRGGTFICPDSQLQTALRGVVKAIDQLPELEKPQIAAVEGSEATIEAFRRLTATFYGMLSFKLPPSADELRDLQKKAVQSVEAPSANDGHKWTADQGGLSKRDYVPLAVALFVDLCLFLVSMVQAPRSRLAGLMPKMQAAERGPVIDILSRFKDIHGDQEIRENFEIFRHVVFDMNGDYYVAVPLDAPPRLNPSEREALRIEAQLLANLFASFEKERIFKRTMLPTTGSVQKRLARQGSKFAGSEAFRVYKFTDGAWSDIILGAIMGAARRAENEKRVFPSSLQRQRPAPVIAASAESADELAGPTAAPAAAMLGAQLGSIPGPAVMGPSQGPHMGRPTGPTPGAMLSRPAPQPQHGAPVPAVAQMNPAPPQPAPRAAPPAAAVEAATRAVSQAASRVATTPRRPMPPQAERRPIDPEQTARFGPYAAYQQPRPVIEPMPPQAPRIARPATNPLPPEAEVTVKAANTNTQTAIPAAQSAVRAVKPHDDMAARMSLAAQTAAPAHEVEKEAAPRETAAVVPLAARTASEATLRTTPPPVPELQRRPDPQDAVVDVTLARETATFSLPMSGVMAAGSLKGAIAQAALGKTGKLPASSSAADNSMPSVIEVLDDLGFEDEVEDVKTDPLTERDLALISRMAPPAAE